MGEKTVAEKMGIKAGQRVLAVNAPRAWPGLIGGLPAGAVRAKDGAADLVHWFVEDQAAVARTVEAALARVGEGNLLWVSYPKKTSRVATDISRDVGWDPLRAAGWEPVAIVSVDETWAALRFKRSGTIPARAAKPAAVKTTAAARPKKEPAVPEDLAKALATAPAAEARFWAMAPSHRKEHIRAIEEAKRPETRARRVAKAIERLLAEG